MLVGALANAFHISGLKGVMCLVDYDYKYQIKKDFVERRSNLEKVEMVK